MRSRASYFALFTLLALCGTPQAEEIRDYYSEPGLNPFKEALHQEINEHIDPFAGSLQHKYVDLFLPGNGGMDIKVTRVYTSLQEALGLRSVTGTGWTMHFGRLVVPTAHKDKLCAQDSYSVHTADNPSIEFPDGGRELLVLDGVHGGYLITKSGWRAKCNDGGEGLIVTSPDGTVYTMDALNTLGNHWSWYTTRVEDRHGNTIDIAYRTNGWNFIYIDTVTASDGREVTFRYEDEAGPHIRLSTITANDQTWTYRYEPVDTAAGGNYYHLAEVVRPDGLKWQYDYFRYDTAPEAVGDYLMSSVTYPYGAAIHYTYDKVDFDPGDVDGQWDEPTTVVATKEVTGTVGGTWTFEYEPNSPDLFFTEEQTWTDGLDKTTVRMPEGRQVYYHYGYSYTGSYGSTLLWLTGMLYKQEAWDGDCTDGNCVGRSVTLVDEVYNEWGTRLISHEDYRHGRGASEPDTFVPELASRVHRRNGMGNQTRYEQYDDFGNARRIVENANIAGVPDKISQRSYHIDREKWILHQVEDETLLGPEGEVISHIDRTFNDRGDVVSENRNGVLSTYTYTPAGDLASVTDARGNTTTYSSYHRGIAGLEEHPGSVTRSRVVNDTGTVASETNGRGFTRHFAYDGLNRLTGISYPVNAPVSITWDAAGNTLVRGDYKERIEVDGFGRPVATTRSDTALGVHITRQIRYDVHGNKVFESYPNSTEGVSYSYDRLKRVTAIQHPDLARRTYTYHGSQVTETDERGNSTTYLYRSYGDPDKDKVLVQTAAPHEIYTIVRYNPLNLPTEVYQGKRNAEDGLIYGYARRLGYDSRFFLISVEDPETGVTQYGRDALGNRVSIKVGAAPVTRYDYDPLNREILIDYPGTTPDVTKSYDADGHVTAIANADSRREYAYDHNDNVLSEQSTIGGVLYTVAYTYDQHDYLQALTYPSGRVIRYFPDAFGRPTRAAPYVTALSYHPSGQLAQLTYANGDVADVTINARQWVGRLHAHGQGEITDLSYDYDALGNVLGIQDALEPGANRGLGYDGMNRLITADGRWGNVGFTYDGVGNLTDQTDGDGSLAYAYNGLLLSRISSASGTTYYAYDAYGHMISKAYITGIGVVPGAEYEYDAAGGLRTATAYRPDGSVQARHHYRYDGEGMRVNRLDTAGVLTSFLYAGGGDLLGEYTGTLAYGKEYLYVGSRQVAAVQTNQAPLAHAGADFRVDSGVHATLDGTASNDADGRIASYAWQQTGGPGVTLSGADSATARFTAPATAVDVALSFQLTVTDDNGDSAMATIAVTVVGNQPPVAHAGPDQSVFGGMPSDLDGRGSRDPDGTIVGYQWTQTGGSGVALDGAVTATPSFTAPVAATHEVLSFDLTVTDNRGATASDTVAVTVSANLPPSAQAGADQTVLGGTLVTLDGRASGDPEGSTISHQWTQTGGPGVVLSDGSSALATFTAQSSDAELRFALTVTDDRGASATDTITVRVLDPTTDADGDRLPDGWEILHFGSTGLYGGGADPDGDGLSNAQEYAEGTDPNTTAPAPIAVGSLWAISGDGEVTLDWTPVPSAAAYDLYWSTSPGVTPANGTSLKNVSRPYVHQGLTNGTPYYYIVVAVNNSGASGSSAEVSANPGVRRWQASISVASGEDLAMNGRGECMLIWRNGRTLWARYHGPNGWRDPKPLHTGTGPLSDPRIALDERGQALAVWREHDGARYNLWSRSYRVADGVWGNAVLVETNNGDQYQKGSVNGLGPLVMNAAGQAVITWIQQRVEWYPTHGGIIADGAYLNYYRPGQGWRSAERLDPQDVGYSSRAPAVELDDAGRYVGSWIVTTDVDGPDLYGPWYDRLWTVYGDANHGEFPVRLDAIPDTATYASLRGTDVAVNGGQAEVVWSQETTSGRSTTHALVLRRLDFATQSWTGPQVLGPRRGSNAPDSPSLSRNAQGQAILAWYEAGSIVSRYAPSTGAWGNFTVLGSGTDPQSGIDAKGHALVAWYNGGTTPTLHAARYVPATGWGSKPAVTLYTGAGGAVLTLKRLFVDPYGNARLLWKGGTLARLSDYAAVAPVSPPNAPPVAGAGPDAGYAGGVAVTLDGSASSDPDGDVLSYNWTQVSGPWVTLNSSIAETPGFTAPYVASDAVLGFALTVSDPYGVTSPADTVSIAIRPNPDPADTTPPVTSVSSTRKNGKIVTYTISLNPDEAASTYVRLIGAASFTEEAINRTDWQVYTSPLQISVTGAATLEYHSIDAAGNTEATHSMTLK